jgi:competence protein ComEA
MRSRTSAEDPVADVTRRRLDALIAELAAARGDAPPPPTSEPARAVPAPPDRGALPTEAAIVGGRHAARPLTVGRRLAGWVGDRLPTALQGRAHLGSAHLGSAQFGLVALVVALGLVAGAWWLVRAGGSSDGAGDVAPPRPVTTATPLSSSTPASSAAPATESSAAPAAAGEQIVVDVVGKVRRPGIAILPVGSRVVDAVRAAGGMRAGVDPTTVNMARPLTDGEQVVIGLPAAAASPGVPAPADASPSAPGTLVNLNTADQATLETLPGVGPVTAAAILEWRDEHGGFTSVDELLEVSGIGDATLAEIAPHVTV